MEMKVDVKRRKVKELEKDIAKLDKPFEFLYIPSEDEDSDSDYDNGVYKGQSRASTTKPS